MQDWENSGGNRPEDESGFSWKAEKNEAMKHYNDYVPEKAYKYEPKPTGFKSQGGANPLFHSSNSGARRSGGYSQNGFGQLKYDYPTSDNTYEKYSPKSAYDDSIFMNTSRESARNAAEKKARPTAQKSGSKQPADKSAGAKKGGKKKSKKRSMTAKILRKLLGADNKRKKSGAQKQNKNKQTPNQSAKNRNTAKRPIDEKQMKKAYEREKRAEENRRKKIERSNQNYNNAKAKGKSGDELRRKRSKRAKRTGKFYAVVSVCTMLVVAVCAILIYCYAHGAPIETIQIDGLTVYSEKELLNAAGIAKGDNMFRIMKGKTNSVVSKSLPYIESVDIDYQLPSTLSMTVTETNEKYLIVNGSNYICVDGNDKIVSDKKKKVKTGKYRLDGFEKQDYTVGEKYAPKDDNEKRFDTAKQIVAAIEKCKIKKCSVIDLSNLNEICITCDSRIKIYVESGTDFERRMKLAAMAIESKVKSGGTYYIDLRYSDMAVLKDGELA